MAYARWGCDGSDVYVYASTEGGYICCGCPRRDAGVASATAAEMIDHLLRDRADGFNVPESALDRLRFESWRERFLGVLVLRAYAQTIDAEGELVAELGFEPRTFGL